MEESVHCDFSDNPVLEALTFNDFDCENFGNATGEEVLGSDYRSSSERNLLCLLCDDGVEDDSLLMGLTNHLLIKHNLIIANFENLPFKMIYLRFWKNKFFLKSYEHICPKNDTGNFLLDGTDPDDKEIREKLRNHKLQELLDIQKKERENDNFNKLCLFCNKCFSKSRIQYLNHLLENHNLNLGPIENIVNIDELLDVIERRIKSLHCLYCEKLFKDNFALKEHMRKKKHKRLRASNKFYFKFFINKHLEANNVADTPDKKENINSDDEDDDTDGEHFNGSHHCLQMKSSFSDWVEDLTSSPSNSIHCLFCRSNFQSSSDTYQHLLVKHQFDLLKIRSGLSYYQCIKLINYIRRKVHQLTCHICSEKFASSGDLFNHFNSSRHSSSTPPPSYYNQPQYFFPTYENDNLLCIISCGVDDDNIGDDADDNPDKEELVKPEDMPLPAISDIITMKKLLES